MVRADPPGLQRQLDGHQHRLQTVHGNGGKHLRHHPVITGVLEQWRCNSCNGSGMVLNGAPLRSTAGLRSIRLM